MTNQIEVPPPPAPLDRLHEVGLGGLAIIVGVLLVLAMRELFRGRR